MRFSLFFLAVIGAAAAGLEPGTLPRSWRSGGPNCMEVPPWQVHEYNPDFYILRESGCTHYEKPFLYLIFGKDRALLEDTGAGNAKTAEAVMAVVSDWSKRNKRATPIPLLVVHSHSHGDHVAGDSQFEGMPNVEVVKAAVPAIQKSFGIQTWPTDLATIDLGGRVLDVIPIPGHDVAGVAYYDRRTGLLLTGDSFYPGRLYVGDDTFETFAASNQRLVDFAAKHPIAHILGTHIEQSRTPFVDYPRGTQYQPDEAPLELSRGDLIELNEAIKGLKGKLAKVELRSLTISPREAPAAPAKK